MNHNEFERYIKETRDCDIVLLNDAVYKGIHRAKTEQFITAGNKVDVMKIIYLAGASVIAAAFCLAINLEPVRAAMPEVLPAGNLMSQSGAEALHGYINNFTNTITIFLGGN